MVFYLQKKQKERHNLDSLVGNYRFVPTEEFFEKVQEMSKEEKNKVSERIRNKIQYVEELNKNVTAFLDILDINSVNILKLLEKVNNKVYKDIFKVKDEVEKLGIKELNDTYRCMAYLDKYTDLIAQIDLELDDLYNCKSILRDIVQ